MFQVIVDMDGTLLDHHNNYDEEFLKFIKESSKYNLIIATGRLDHDIKFIENKINFHGEYRISLNGCCIKNKNNDFILKLPINIDIAKLLVSSLQTKVDRVEVNTFENRLFPSIRPDHFAKEYFDSSIVGDLHSLMENKEIAGLLIFVEESKYEEVNTIIEKILKNYKDVLATRTSLTSIEIFSALGSKGNAIKYLQENKLIENDYTIACGDADNDISMFEVSDLSFAMKNGTLNAQKNATYVVENLRDVIKELK